MAEHSEWAEPLLTLRACSPQYRTMRRSKVESAAVAALDGDALHLMVRTLGLDQAAGADDPAADGNMGNGVMSSALAAGRGPVAAAALAVTAATSDSAGEDGETLRHHLAAKAGDASAGGQCGWRASGSRGEF